MGALPMETSSGAFAAAPGRDAATQFMLASERGCESCRPPRRRSGCATSASRRRRAACRRSRRSACRPPCPRPTRPRRPPRARSSFSRASPTSTLAVRQACEARPGLSRRLCATSARRMVPLRARAAFAHADGGGADGGRWGYAGQRLGTFPSEFLLTRFETRFSGQCLYRAVLLFAPVL